MTKEIILVVPVGVHRESTYDRGNTSFLKLTTCSDCESILDYWSNNTRVCKFCGGKLVEGIVGRWNSKDKQWECRK